MGLKVSGKQKQSVIINFKRDINNNTGSVLRMATSKVVLDQAEKCRTPGQKQRMRTKQKKNDNIKGGWAQRVLL